MSETKNPGEKKLSVGKLTLKPRTETGVVRQSFSHGRSKQVVVEQRSNAVPSADRAKPKAEPAPVVETKKTAPSKTPAPAPTARPQETSQTEEQSRKRRASCCAPSPRKSAVHVRMRSPIFLACAKPKSARSPKKEHAAAQAASWSIAAASGKRLRRASARKMNGASTTRKRNAKPAKSPRSVSVEMKRLDQGPEHDWRSRPMTTTAPRARAGRAAAPVRQPHHGPPRVVALKSSAAASPW